MGNAYDTFARGGVARCLSACSRCPIMEPMIVRKACVLLLLVASCGGGTTDNAENTEPDATSGQLQTSTATTVPIASAPPGRLASYRFTMTVAVTPEPGTEGQPVAVLHGEATTAPRAMRLSGDLAGRPVDIVTDGTRWWDLDDTALALTDEDIRYFLGANGFLLPSDLTALRTGADTWQTISAGEHLGVPVTQLRRFGVIKDRDWALGDLAQLDVWEDATGEIVRFAAWFATGDNAGFPVAQWEITERNPELEIGLPDS